jgi:hypothetical protein
MKILVALLLLTGFLTAQEETGGPIIEKLTLSESDTVGEAIALVRTAALKKDKFFALSVNLDEHELAAKFSGRLSLKKVPALIALKYLCLGSALDLTNDQGLWKIEARSNEEGPDEIQIILEGISPDEFLALGLTTKKGIGLITDDGKKWPSGEFERSHRLDGKLILRASLQKVENLKALLKLLRAGYKIPKINGNQQ